MKALVMNCSPVRNGATAEIVNIVSKCLQERYDVRNICIDDFDIRSSYLNRLLIGQTFPDSSKLLLTDVHPGAIPMSRMQL